MNTVSLPRNLVYSKAAAARILGVSVGRIVEIRVYDRAVWTLIKGRRPQFMSKRKFEKEFIDFRREAGKLLNVLGMSRSRFGTVWTVEGRGDCYQVELNGDRLNCNCEDFHQHEEVCKHGWAVLHSRECNTIAELKAHLICDRNVERYPAPAVLIAEDYADQHDDNAVIPHHDAVAPHHDVVAPHHDVVADLLRDFESIPEWAWQPPQRGASRVRGPRGMVTID